MKSAPSLQKLRGGYYTPEVIATFLAQWAIKGTRAKVLEPSCGDGAFLEAAARRLRKLGARPAQIGAQIFAAEFDAGEAAKAEQRLSALTQKHGTKRIRRGDFFSYCRDSLAKQKFDAILGNPPFIRYQHFPEAHRKLAFGLMEEIGLHPTRLTNAWLPFIAVCTELLSEHGRLAMVVPAELLQVNYAAELRKYLSDKCHRITVFTFRRLVFDDVQQEVVLLCVERDGGGNTGIRTIELEDLSELADYEHTPFDQEDLKPMDHTQEKWTQYFLSIPQIEMLRTMRGSDQLTAIGDLADVEVGVVTGLNDFFVLREEAVVALSAKAHVLRLVARSAHLKGLSFKTGDWRSNASEGLPAYLLTLPGVGIEDLPKKLARYVREGEAKDWHTGYKCRIRTPWYQVPSTGVPDGFMLRQIHDRPRMFANTAQATSTDTIHRVRVRKGVDIRKLAASCYNSLSFAFAEVLGRSYGGGVLELEPREARQVPVPFKHAARLDLEKLDRLLRSGAHDEALAYADGVLLRKGMGLTERQILTLRHTWSALRDRRTGRRVRSDLAEAV